MAKKKKRKAKRAPKKKSPRAAKKTTARRRPRRTAAKRRAKAPKKRARSPKRAAVARAPARKSNAVDRRWFDRYAGWTGKGRLPAVTLSAGYWAKSVAARQRFVRRLSRGSRKQRRVSVAVARAEQRRADGSRGRRPNPGMSDPQAAREYVRTHWGERGDGGRPHGARSADPRFGTATKMGDLVAVTYRTKKGGDREATDYEHEFEGPLPKLLYNPGGLLIAGGGYRIRKGGIAG